MAAPAIGVFLPTMSRRGQALGDIGAVARQVEDFGFESAWAVDQLVAGTGVPIIESTVALSAAAGATSSIQLAYGVMILPLRPVVWAAKHVASLQHVSGSRVLLGIGLGGDRHDRSWEQPACRAATWPAYRCLARGAARPHRRQPRRHRRHEGRAARPGCGRTAHHRRRYGGRRTHPGRHVWRRMVRASDSRLRNRARGSTAHRAGCRSGRPVPAITGSVSTAIDGDPALPDYDGLVRELSDPDGVYGMPADAVPGILVTGGPAAVADRISALGAIGAERVVVTLAAGNWSRQLELLADATAMLH